MTRQNEKSKTKIAFLVIKYLQNGVVYCILYIICSKRMESEYCLRAEIYFFAGKNVGSCCSFARNCELANKGRKKNLIIFKKDF